MSEIVLRATADFHDEELREWVKSLEEKIKTLNERTKLHTIDIKNLLNKKEVKKNG